MKSHFPPPSLSFNSNCLTKARTCAHTHTKTTNKQPGVLCEPTFISRMKLQLQGHNIDTTVWIKEDKKCLDYLYNYTEKFIVFLIRKCKVWKWRNLTKNSWIKLQILYIFSNLNIWFEMLYHIQHLFCSNCEFHSFPVFFDSLYSLITSTTDKSQFDEDLIL